MAEQRRLGSRGHGTRAAALAVVAALVVGATGWAAGADEADAVEPSGDTVVLVVGRADGVSTGDISAALDDVDVAAVATVPRLDATTVTLAAADVPEAIRQIGDQATYVEPSVTYRALGLEPADPLAGDQYELEQIGVPGGWQRTLGAGQVVAVLDTGIRPGGDLVDAEGTSLVPGWDFVDGDGDPADPSDPTGSAHDHGTYVATVLAARSNSFGVVGACPECRIMPVRVLDTAGEGSDVHIAQGIQWAVAHGATVINLSLGGPGASSIVADAVADARDHDVVVVAAAGNLDGGEPTDVATAPFYPAAYPGVLAVAATCSPTAAALDPSPCAGVADGDVAPFSRRGPAWVDVAAPGVNLGTAGSDVVYFRGTSAATPLVAAGAGLLRAAHPGWTEAQVRQAVTATAVPLPTAAVVASGEIRVAAAIAASPTPNPGGGASGSSGGGTFTAQSDQTPPAGHLVDGDDVVGGITVADVAASDDVAVASVTLEVAGRAVGTAWVAHGGVWQVPWDTTRFPDGRTGLQAVVTDTSGNTVRTAGIYVTVDNTAPSVALVGPAFGARVRGTFGVLAFADDRGAGVRVTLVVAGAEWVGGGSGAVVGARIRVRRNGPMVVRAVAVDRAGHSTVSNPVVVNARRR